MAYCSNLDMEAAYSSEPFCRELSYCTASRSRSHIRTAVRISDLTY